jgi:spermidine synthase
MDCVRAGWFTEINEQWPGIANSLKVEEVLLEQKSEFQDVMVFRSASFGNVLILDKVIQLTERDECAYQEMITHLPMFAHPDPKVVLIIGGGDGGCLREVVKHKGVEKVFICEIDQVVIDAGKKYFPGVASAWDDPRVTLVTNDASKFIQSYENYFDVIVCDSSDPVGPAEPLFGEKFYLDMHKSLRPGGRVCCQGESMWQHKDLIKKLVTKCGKPFRFAEYATTQIPTYPCGQIGLLVCSKDGVDVKSAKTPSRRDEDVLKTCNYYSPELHSAAFVLPAFLTRALNE